jgi:predicted regulator of Ras-like GTPase activity (Roadblock/LC7/MglB family)
MDAAQALADLTEISSQIEAAVLFDESGAVEGSTLSDEQASQALARAAGDLLGRVTALRTDGEVTQLAASTARGSLFVVRSGNRRIAAATGPAPTVGLVFYDLKSCLRDSESEPSEPKKPARTRRKKADDAT